jgi:hypothetical protein
MEHHEYTIKLVKELIAEIANIISANRGLELSRAVYADIIGKLATAQLRLDRLSGEVEDFIEDEE